MIHLDDIKSSWLTAFLINSFIFYWDMGREECIFIGPAIYIASPGPIFFLQERDGKNGKKFKMYKFRSMYLDAEERKAELMKHNKLGDGKMFKLDFGPRVIGNKVMWIDHIKQALANLFVKQVWMNFHNS